MTVEVKVGTEKIRVINGYGPQESEDSIAIINNWQEFESEVIKANDLNINVIIQMDANAKLGSDIIKGCPHKMSNNGKLLYDIIERQDLIVVNALEICKGTITRERIFQNKTEKSVIDYIIVSRGLRIKTMDWNMKQLENVLKGLKNNTSMDPNGMVNETFKEGYMGSDLKNALLIFFNSIKSNHIIPHYMTLGNITTIYKSKGSRLDLNNDRGIFILTVMKKILEKLIYNDIYKDIDQNMSDCNIGSRKKRNIRDHLLIIHGVIYSVIRGKEDLVDIQIYDIEKAFDTLWS